MLIYPSLIKLDDYELTDEGRAPVSVDREFRGVENELASGKTKRYFKTIGKLFTISWENLPASDDSLIDGGLGRDSMKELFRDSMSTHELTYSDEMDDEEVYRVWVDSYTEEVTRRAPDDFLWNVSLTLKTV